MALPGLTQTVMWKSIYNFWKTLSFHKENQEHCIKDFNDNITLSMVILWNLKDFETTASNAMIERLTQKSHAQLFFSLDFDFLFVKIKKIYV